jgi:hypothetical protein
MNEKKEPVRLGSDPSVLQIQQKDAAKIIIPGYTGLEGGMVRLVMSEDDYAWILYALESTLSRIGDDHPGEALAVLGAFWRATAGDPRRGADPRIEEGVRIVQDHLLLRIADLAALDAQAASR